MIWRVVHSTEYTYAQPVSGGWNLLHLRPRATPSQRCRSTTIEITPTPSVRSERFDFFWNGITFSAVQEPHRELLIVATSEVEIEPPAPFEVYGDVPWEQARDLTRDPRGPGERDVWQFTLDSPLVRASATLRAFAEPSFSPGRPLLEATFDLCGRIYRDFAYRPGSTSVATSPEDILVQRTGVCQDFAHVGIGALRSLGLAARYVSGYLATGRFGGTTPFVGADASHAWLAVWSPTAGWIDFDPTNDVPARERHITLACGRDFDDVSPVRGVVVGGGAHAVRVGVEVAPLDAAPPLSFRTPGS